MGPAALTRREGGSEGAGAGTLLGIPGAASWATAPSRPGRASRKAWKTMP